MMKYSDINILYEDNHLLVVVKPENVLSQADSTNDLDMLTLLKEYIKVSKNKPGNVYLGLVQRLDRRVGGVMVFAKTSKAASRLSEDIRNHKFNKTYLAVVLGKIENDGILIHKLKKESLKAVDSFDGKESKLEYEVLNSFELDDREFSVLKINLITGRYNQIRSQLSLINHPIIDDFKYGYRGKNYNDVLGLFCYQIKFNHPVTKEEMEFSYKPDWEFWSLLKGVPNEKI